MKASLVQALKRNRAFRMLSNNSVAEALAESLNRRLPLNYRVMRLVSRSNYLRSAAIRYHASHAREALKTASESIVEGLNVDSAVNELDKKGFAAGIILPKIYVDRIISFCGETAFIDDFSKEPVMIDLADEKLPRPGILNYRCPNPHLRCETVDRLTRDPAIVAVARGYLKTEPLLRSSRIFWSYPDVVKGYNPLYGFHYDIDDYKFLKIFFYLCDVDVDRGPHVIIEATHKKKDWFEKNHRRLTDEQAELRYHNRIKVITGPSGSAFFEDTFCYHKGSTPRKRRLLLEFQYAISAAAVL